MKNGRTIIVTVIVGIICCARIAQATLGWTQAELVEHYGPIQETLNSVAGEKFTDLTFLRRSPADNRVVVLKATMMDGICHNIAYGKADDSGNPAPITDAEIRAWGMLALRGTDAQWKRLTANTWETMHPRLGKVTAERTSPEFFMIGTEALIRRSLDM